MIIRLDHVGVVAHSWGEARDALVDRLGFPVDIGRTPTSEGNLYAPQNTRIYFVKVGEGETLIEVLIPNDDQSGIARYLARRGAGLHHLGYACDDVPASARELRERGLEQIDIGDGQNGIFFFPKSAMGILTELVRDRAPLPLTPITQS